MCPQEEGVMPLVAQPPIPGFRTLASLSGGHSLLGIVRLFRRWWHGHQRNACGCLEEFAIMQVLLAKSEDCQIALFLANCRVRTNAPCTREWGGGKACF